MGLGNQNTLIPTASVLARGGNDVCDGGAELECCSSHCLVIEETDNYSNV